MTSGARAPFDPAAFASAREELGPTWGRPLRLFEETTSTNDRALEASATDMKTGGVFVAEAQTGGRGRRGNVWLSAPGENLTFSLLLRLPVPPERTSTLALVVGLALRSTIGSVLDEARIPLPATVKWPNDVLVGERKVAGILVETRVRDGETAAVVGVGMNVHQRTFPPEAGRPTSLELVGVPAASLSRERLLARFLRDLEQRMAPWLTRGFASVHSEFRGHDALLGRSVLVDERPGIARGVSETGELFLELEEGSLLAIASGHVRFELRS